MKKLYQLSAFAFAFLLMLSTQSLFAQATEAAPTETTEEAAPTEGAMIQFEKTTHDFGTLTQGDPAIYEFKFTNTGTENLKISYAKGSCGCTVPKWPKDEIAPGASDVIKVKYDSNRIGGINKNVTITSNAVNTPTQRIYIKGNIKPKPAAPVEVAPTPEKVASPAPAAEDHSGHDHSDPNHKH